MFRTAAASVVLSLAIMHVPSQVEAQTQHLEQLSRKYTATLDEIARDVPGVIGIAVVDLTTGERFGVNEGLVFPQGSSIKVPLLIELFRQADEGALQLDEAVVIDESVRTGGSGILRHFSDGASALSLRDLAVLMIVLSDNTATNILIDRAGMDNVNRTMAALGFPNTKLQRRMIRPQDSAAGRENVATPAEAAGIMARIAECDLPMSRDSCEDLRSILELPKATPGSIPSGSRVAWKGGSITGVRAGWGIIDLPGRPFAIGVMVNYTDGAAAEDAIAAVVEASHAHFARLAGVTSHGARVPLRYLDPPSRN
ncbi:MAG TPA: serine hydrolase [Longimicrobiales bacterium]|nr:serine hydrolase [Longimicrobiales bacterium]